MRSKQILEGNAKIATFLGYEKVFGEWEKKVAPATKSVMLDATMDYHYSWKSIMYVVKEIGKLGHGIQMQLTEGYNHILFYDKEGEGEVIHPAIDKDPITATWKAVIAFIDWYNKSILES